MFFPIILNLLIPYWHTFTGWLLHGVHTWYFITYLSIAVFHSWLFFPFFSFTWLYIFCFCYNALKLYCWCFPSQWDLCKYENKSWRVEICNLSTPEVRKYITLYNPYHMLVVAASTENVSVRSVSILKGSRVNYRGVFALHIIHQW